MTRLRHFIMVVAATVSLILMPAAAEAAYQQLYCDGQGGVGGGQLYYADPGSNQGACQFTDMQHVFSKIICNFVVILNDVLGKVYCGMQYLLENTMAVLLTLYIAVFGAQILMGTAQLQAKEMIVRFLKIAGVWAFVTQSAWGIGLAFNFFIGFITEGIWWVINSVLPAMNPTSNNVMPVYTYIDSIIYQAITGPITQANSKLVGFMLGLMLAFPPVAAMGLYWLKTMIWMLARTLISFMLGISAIAFLISLSPIFLSFMLFQSTFHIFESWLRYMMSFALQIIIVFACVAMWIAIMKTFIDFFDMLTKLIFPYQKALANGPAVSPEDTWAICPPQISTGLLGPEAECTSGFDPSTSADDYKNLVPLAAIPTDGDFLYFLVYHMVTLLLVVYAFNILLEHAPSIAKELVGPDVITSINAGWGTKGVSNLMNSLRGSGGSRALDQKGVTNGLRNMAQGASESVRGFLNQANQLIQGSRRR